MQPLKLTLQVVTWNSARHLPALLTSLKEQKFKEYRLTVIDNASTDDSLALVRREFPRATILRNSENLGFSAAHNQGIQMSDSPYIGLINPDIVMTPDALTILMQSLEKQTRIGAIGPKMLRRGEKYDIIDSAGIRATRYREFVNRGEGERDQGQYDTPEEVFGLTGAFMILRAAALDSIRIGTEYLDEDLFAYKDDIDLCWRLRLAGWGVWYEPRATLYHERHVRHEQELSVPTRRVRKTTTVNRLSYRNHLLVLTKNDRIRSWLLPMPSVLFYEAAKFFYALFREPRTLLGLWDAARLLTAMRAKRTVMFRHRKIPFRAVNAWFR